jgi:glutathione S-transferase
MTLYDYELDDACYKVRLLLSLLSLPYRKIAVDVFPGGEDKSPALLALNPSGRLPILVDDDAALSGAEAILLYLAHRYDGARQFLPVSPRLFGAVAMWLQFASVDLEAAVVARRQSLFGDGEDAALIARAKRALRIMDDHMTMREFDGGAWFVGDDVTIADIALFPAIGLSRDIGVDHDAYPALRRWMRRLRQVPGFVTMPGIPDYY